jgi:hypothetical protein
LVGFCLLTIVIEARTREILGDYLLAFADSAAARRRNAAMVAAEGSLRFPLLFRRLGLVE